MSEKLIRGTPYKYINSKAVPTGYGVSRGDKVLWVHIMGPDFEPVNGIFALYSEDGKFKGGHDEKLLDIDPKAVFEEEEFVIEDKEEEFVV